jgi:ABC-type glycerol-3-phosphate transport system substrate-binding protein
MEQLRLTRGEIMRAIIALAVLVGCAETETTEAEAETTTNTETTETTNTEEANTNTFENATPAEKTKTTSPTGDPAVSSD